MRRVNLRPLRASARVASIDSVAGFGRARPRRWLAGRPWWAAPGAWAGTRVGALEVAFWCAVAALSLALAVTRSGGVRLYNDSYQYLSVAESLARGEGNRSSIVHYDLDYRQGSVPAAMTAFPPGFPLAIAPLLSLGLRGEVAAGLVSGLSLVALVPLLCAAGAWLSLPLAATRAALVLLLVNAHVGFFAGAALSESLFTLLSTAALLSALRAEGQGGPSRAYLALAGALAGLSFGVRFAGVFLLGALVAYYGWRWLRRRTARAFGELACVALPLPFIAGYAAYRLATDTLKGGNTKEVFRGLKFVAVETARALVRLGLPERRLDAQSLDALWFGLAAVAAGATVWLCRRSPSIVTRAPARGALPLVALYVVAYVAGMTYLQLVTPINTGVRLFYPLLPLYVLGAAFAIERAASSAHLRGERPAYASMLALGLAAYGALHLSHVRPDERASQRVLPRWLAQPTAAGPTVAEWVEQNVPPDGVIIADDGQATGHLLRRKTLSLAGAEISDQRWTEGRVRELFDTYRASLLVLYPSADPGRAQAQAESAFLADLLAGKAPSWLEVAVETDEVRAFRLARVDGPSAQLAVP
ncbi:MAG TPA: hypothetical protein VFS43_46485 [Polyangiaceae bacterium]|nr:hypothetical protein [Polyangiaceae bacterium]